MTAVVRLGVLESRIVLAGFLAPAGSGHGLAQQEHPEMADRITRLLSYAERFYGGKGGLVRLDPLDILIVERAARMGARALCRHGRTRYVPGRHIEGTIERLKRAMIRLLAKLERVRKRLHRRLARRDPAGWREQVYRNRGALNARAR